MIYFLPPASAVEVIESVPSVCVSVCQHSHNWTVLTQNLTCRSTWTISRSSLMFKVIGQRSWSPGEKMWCLANSTDFFLIWKAWYKTLAYHVISGHLVMPQLDVTPSCDITKWRHLGKRTLKISDAGGAWTLRRFHFKILWHPKQAGYISKRFTTLGNEKCGLTS